MKNIVLVINEDNINEFLNAVEMGAPKFRAAIAALMSSRHGNIEDVGTAYATLLTLSPCFGEQSQKLRDITLDRLRRRGAERYMWTITARQVSEIVPAPLEDVPEECESCDFIRGSASCEGCEYAPSEI